MFRRTIHDPFLRSSRELLGLVSAQRRASMSIFKLSELVGVM